MPSINIEFASMTYVLLLLFKAYALIERYDVRISWLLGLSHAV